MKNLLLSIFLSLAMSFSFAQSNSKADVKEKAYLKKNTVTAVNFLAKNLNLDSKQKAIFMNAFSQYGFELVKAEMKMLSSMPKENITSAEKVQAKKDEVQIRKRINESILRLAAKRDAMVIDCLKGRQVRKYKELINTVNPTSLKFDAKKK